MKDSTFKVAGLTFTVKDPCDILEDIHANYLPFLCGGDDPSGHIFTLELVNEPFPAGELTPLYVDWAEVGMPLLNLYSHPGGYRVEMAVTKGMPICGWMEMSGDFATGKLYLDGKRGLFCLDNALMLLYAFSTATRGVLQMHSSVVMHRGKGYMFLGKSGTGKSTHSRMWLENIPGTELLNDDNPIIRCMDDGSVRVFGSPWSGKTPCYKSKDVPVGAIVRIQQAPRNEIHRLDLLQAYCSVYSSASGFRPIPHIGDGLHRTISTVVGKVPCYTLECLPDGDAARVCHGEVTSTTDE